MPFDGRVLDQASQDLLSAANILRTGGHCKYTLKHHTRHCIMGAIIEATSDCFPLCTTRTRQVMAKLTQYGLTDTSHLVVWNNAPERTAEEVISLLEEAAFS